jgi:hypothetical protein
MAKTARAVIAASLLLLTAQAALTVSPARSAYVTSPVRRQGARSGPVLACIIPSPTAEQSAQLEMAMPSPALQPREVVAAMLSALHRTNIDSPRPRFGCEVALRFLAPSNPASKVGATQFANYLSQTWYQALLNWSEYRWEGDLTLLGESEAFQQVSVRTAPDQPWVSVRWILKRVPFYGTADMWMVEAVFVEEPDGSASEMPLMPPSFANAEGGATVAPPETPGGVVLTIMNAIRKLNEPYPLHGCEVAIRYCSPSNRASRLSPQSFAQYLNEPWYRILVEWDAIELDEPEQGEDANTMIQDALVRREGDESWTIVNWRLSRHSGRWLTDALSITE